jgi:hypothetical protein
MQSPNFTDIAFIVLLAATVPFLVNCYLLPSRFSISVRRWIIVGGLCWMVYVVFSQWVSAVIGAPWLDAYYHDFWAQKLVEGMSRGGWSVVWNHFRVGNQAYQCYLALLYSTTGATIYTATAINGWLALWAGLILAYHFSTFCPLPKDKPFFAFWTIFCPSVVFWCTINLKEAMMFWAIANVFVVSFVQKGNNYSLSRIVVTAAAIAVGGLLRPHVLLGWIAAVASVTILHRGRRLLALLVLLCVPLVFVSMLKIVPIESSKQAGSFAEKQFEALNNIQHQGSQISYENQRPIFFVSGFVAAFFRPFPWEIRSVRLLAGSLEVWTMTLLIFFAWRNLRNDERAFVFNLPMTRVALLGILWMCVILTYYPNEGLMLRQRVQMIPGLLALAVLPASLRHLTRIKEEMMKTALIRAYYGNPDPPAEPTKATPVGRRLG